MTATPHPAPPLGEWAVEAYGRPGVEDACLVLQDRHGMDVVAVLWCCWAGAHHGTIDGHRLAEIVAALMPWHGEVVAPLRAVRRRLAHPDAVAGETAAADAAGAARDGLRRQVAEAELAAEVIQLDHLERLTIAAQSTAQIDGRPGGHAMATNLSCLAAIHGGDPEPGLRAAIDAFLARVDEPDT